MVENLIVLPILTNFTLYLVKIGLKLVLNSFSSLKLQNSRPGEAGGGEWEGTPISGQYGYVPRESPQFFGLDYSTVSTWATPKDPPFKNKQFFVLLFRPGQIEKFLV